MPQDIVYLNGDFLPVTEAKVSVLDRGFLFGDGIYEVIPVYNYKLFRLKQHIQRLQRSLKAVAINVPFDSDDWQTLFADIVQRNKDNGPSQMIYLEVTRGAAPVRHHTYQQDLSPTIFCQSKPLTTLTKQTLETGKTAVTSTDIRWHRCDIKAVSLLANVMASQHAKNENCNETIFIRDGLLTEGSTSNVFIVKNDTLITPPLGPHLLGGVTRDLTLELARKNQVTVEEREVTADELRTADELWITSSTREIFPIVTLDQQPIKNGQVGPLWHKLIDLYHQYITTL